MNGTPISAIGGDGFSQMLIIKLLNRNVLVYGYFRAANGTIPADTPLFDNIPEEVKPDITTRVPACVQASGGVIPGFVKINSDGTVTHGGITNNLVAVSFCGRYTIY